MYNSTRSFYDKLNYLKDVPRNIEEVILDSVFIVDRWSKGWDLICSNNQDQIFDISYDAEIIPKV